MSYLRKDPTALNCHPCLAAILGGLLLIGSLAGCTRAIEIGDRVETRIHPDRTECTELITDNIGASYTNGPDMRSCLNDIAAYKVKIARLNELSRPGATRWDGHPSPLIRPRG